MFDFRGQGKGMALAAMLFGMSAAAQAGEGRLLYASLGDTTRSPIGWVEFCADNAAQCQGAPTQPRDIVMSQAAWRDPRQGQSLGQRDRQAFDRPGALGRDREVVAAVGRLRRL
ncbi:putative transglutaminase-like cysteine proteinase [Bradyrhizobium sp. LB7.2]